MNTKSIRFYLEEAEDYAGKNQFNADGSNFSLTPSSELSLKYEQLRQRLTQQNSQTKVPRVAKNWSNKITQVLNENQKTIPLPQPLCLENLDTLCRDRYLVADLSPEDLAHFPLNTLGGAYFQYMCHGKFYEFDKNPITPDSDLKWIIRLLRQTHDFYHLVAEIYHYGWDGGFIIYNDSQYYARDLLVLSEEVCLYAFILGQVRLKATIPIIAEWANNCISYCFKWLKDAYQLWLHTHNFETVKKFSFPTLISNCEKLTYASFKLGYLNNEICVDEYLQELYEVLDPLPSQATPEDKECRDMVLESFERGLRSNPLVCLQWDRYLGNTLQDVREFLNIPRRKFFRDGSYYLESDLY